MNKGNSKKINIQTGLSGLIIMIGIILMVGKIYVDSEPGAIPLLLIIFGFGWFFITRSRIRSQHEPG